MALLMHLRLREEEQAAAIARRAAASVMRGSVSVDVEMVSLLVNELVVRVLHRADPDQPVDLRLEATPTLLRVNVAAPAPDGGAPQDPRDAQRGMDAVDDRPGRRSVGRRRRSCDPRLVRGGSRTG